MDALEQARENLEYMRIKAEDILKVERLGFFAFTVWGMATLLAVGLTYLLINLGFGGYTSVAWVVSMYGALAVSATYARRQRFHLSSLSGRILNHVWLSVSISAFFLAFVLGRPIHLNEGWVIYFVVVQILIAIAVFVTGGIYMLPTLKKIGVMQWLGALLTAAVVPSTWVPLEFGIAVGGGLLAAALMTRRSGSAKPDLANDEALQ